MFRRALAVVPVLFVLAACRTAADEPVVKTTEPSIRADDGLGAPCEAGGTVNGIEPCGSKQRVSVRIIPHSMMKPGGMVFPCTLAKPSSPREKEAGATEVSSCITEGTLYANADCLMCRIPGAGWNVIAKLDELTPAQSLTVQSRLMLPNDAPLRGEKAWRAALNTPEAHASL